MQLFPNLAKTRVPLLLQSMVAAACQRGPEPPALPPCPLGFWEKEKEKREREIRERQVQQQWLLCQMPVDIPPVHGSSLTSNLECLAPLNTW
jgi:hypothetical protein